LPGFLNDHGVNQVSLIEGGSSTVDHLFSKSLFDSGSKRVLIIGRCQIKNNGFDIHDKFNVVLFSKGCTPLN